MRWSALILAAGASSRLGRPKQLLVWGGEPLVRRAAHAALDAGAHEVVVVLGAHADRVRPALTGLDVRFAENAQWQEGIGGSIACGARACVPGTPILVMLSDQPAVEAPLLRQLVGEARSGAITVACRYEDTVGVPAFFSAPEDLAALSALSGDLGAKPLLRGAKVRRIETDLPAHDIDVEADWLRWKSRDVRA